MRIPVEHIPQDIMQQYDLKRLIVNNHVLVEIRKGIYGLPQAGLIAQKRLNAHLAKFGYYKCKFTHVLYGHKTRKTTSTLIVHDFGIKYNTKDDANHLLNYLHSLYDMTTDWAGTLYIGLYSFGVLSIVSYACSCQDMLKRPCTDFVFPYLLTLNIPPSMARTEIWKKGPNE